MQLFVQLLYVSSPSLYIRKGRIIQPLTYSNTIIVKHTLVLLHNYISIKIRLTLYTKKDK